MIKKWTLLLYLLCLSTMVSAQDATQLMVQGDSAYAAGEFKQAISLYTQADSLIDDANLYYNLGNSYYRVGNVGQPILQYQRALLLAPADLDAQHNLKLAQALTVDKIDADADDAMSGWWQSTLLSIGASNLTWASILSAVLAALAWAAFSATGGRGIRQLTFASGMLLTIACLALSLMAISASNAATAGDRGVILAKRVKVNSSPTGGTELFVLHEGAEVTIRNSSEAYLEVALPNGNVGWVSQDDIGLVVR